MKATPVETPLNACARIANTMAINVDQTAASWGDFSKGVATKRDQLASESLKYDVRATSVTFSWTHKTRMKTYPQRTWTTRTKPAFVPVKIRKCHIIDTITHAGKYAVE